MLPLVSSVFWNIFNKYHISYLDRSEFEWGLVRQDVEYTANYCTASSLNRCSYLTMCE